ncbi:MAG: single-stranded DNA-binding protein [Spirochaetales bacterium]|nr:single-stranded DNA-binding protein [Spirochaetales bacterium]
MQALNSIILEGNLVRKPDAKLTAKGTPVCNFTVASNRYFRLDGSEETKEEVSFFDVETWAKQAEICEKHLERGRGVRVVGRLKQDRWTDKEGKNQSRIKIVAEHIEFRPRTKKQDDEPVREAPKEERAATETF